MTWEKVAIPLVQGLDIKSRARLAEPTTLQIADNVFFPKDNGPEKRYGYVSTLVRKETGAPAPVSVTSYTYGWGMGTASTSTSGGSIISESPYYDAGPVRSIAKRDTEVVVLAGDTLYNQNRKISKIDIFSAETNIIAKNQASPNFPDLADNGIIKVVAYYNSTTSLVDMYCYDSVTNSLKFKGTLGVSDPQYVTVIPVGNFVHIYVNDINVNHLYLYVVKHTDIALGSSIDLGDCKANFDVFKVSEAIVFVGKRSLTDGILAGYLDFAGSSFTDYCPWDTVVNIGADTVTGFSVAVHPDSTVGILWDAGANQKARVYYSTLATLGSIQTVTAYASNVKQTIVPDIDTNQQFHFFVDDISGNKVTSGAFTSSGSATSGIIYNCNLVGKAFNIGTAPFVWVCRPETLQTTFFICNLTLNVVGKLEYGTAINNSGDQWLFSSNTYGHKVHGCFLIKRNVLNQPGIFHEPTIKEWKLDFDFQPRPAQVGKDLYYPGCQVLCYDGESISELGFNLAVEDAGYVQATVAGTHLTLLGTYYYLIYPCHKNANGEEIRGPAILSAAQTLTGTNNQITITGKTIPSLRSDSYFLIYRNANTGTTWHLVSDRDPQSASCPKNNQSNATWTFVDSMPDSTLAATELDSFTSSNYLLPFAAPSCTILSYGKNRLWAAGGEIPGFQVWPSRLFSEYETPTFNPALAYNIDSDIDPITAIGFISNYTAVFKRTKGYIITGDGVDNTLVGSYFNSEKILTDIGSISSALCNINAGIIFQSDGNYRLMDSGGKVVNISEPIKDFQGNLLGTYILIKETTILFYQDNCILCWNYQNNLWSKWTIVPEAVSDCEYIGIGNKILTQGTSYLDGDKFYEVRIKTGPFSAQLGDFQRIRKVAGIGTGSGTFKINVYLDEKEYYSDSFTITKPDVTSEWGDSTWGTGFWGDSLGSGTFISDDRMRWVKRLSQQKCTCVELEFVYNGNDRGPIHYAFIVEYGTKNGIDRTKG